MSNPSSGGSADQSSGQWDPAAGGGPRDTRISAQPASYSHGGDGRVRHRAAQFLPSSHGLAFLRSIPAEQKAQRFGSQAAHHSKQPGPEAHQEVTFQGCEEGKLFKWMLVVMETTLGQTVKLVNQLDKENEWSHII